MTSRTIHSGASFAIVLVAYWTYALLAVPWIEPPPTSTTRPTGGKDVRILPPNLLAVLFPPGSWQLCRAKTITSDGQTLLLWDTYQNCGDGWVDLKPLTIIYIPDETEIDKAERFRHAVVMDVPEGAKLRFDRPLDLTKGGGMGRLMEGKLRGPVQIRSRGKRSDRQDDLLVDTHDVDLSERSITTPSDVDFRWGLHSGRGRQMEIKLLRRLGPHDGNQDGPDIGGIEQFQLEHVERLHLEQLPADPDSVAAAPAAGTKPADGPQSPLAALTAQPAPVEITCRGPFRFNLVEQVATFRDQVDVLRIHPNGPCDDLSCELLSIFFTRAAPLPGAAAAEKKGGPGADLKPDRIVAQGTPTTLNAPLDHLQAHAERLECKLKDDKITQIYLEDTQEVMLQKDTSEIHAPSLRYTPGPAEHTGQFQLLASGPGWLKGEMAARTGPQLEARSASEALQDQTSLARRASTLAADTPAQPRQQLEAHWQEKLEAQPQGPNEVISLLGGARLSFPAMGQLDAREIHFWLRESPPQNLLSPDQPSIGARKGAGGESNLQPDRLLAEGHVVGDSPQFSTKVERLEVWFTSPAVVAAAPAGPSVAYLPSTDPRPKVTETDPRLEGPALEARSGQHAPMAGEAMQNQASSALRASRVITQGVSHVTAGGMPPSAVVGSLPASPRPALGLPGAAAAGGRQSHLEITGRLLQACVLMRDSQHGDLTEATVVDNVRLQETQQTALPGDVPLLVTGGTLHATRLNTPQQAVVTVKGEPAHAEGHGMSLTGPIIHIDQGANKLAMEGPGWMETALDHDLENQPLSQPESMKINWQKNMLFDGRKAHFQDAVNVISASRLMVTGSLDVYFQKPISFSDAQQQRQQPKVERLICGNGVFVENRTIEGGQQASYDRMKLKNFDLNNITGDFYGDGPGWLNSVRHGSSQPFAPPGGPLAGPGPSAVIRPAGFGPPQTQPADPNQLMCCHLTFLRSLTGNKLRKDFVFHGQVHAAYAPAQSWMTMLDSFDPVRLGPGAVVLSCDDLKLSDMSLVSGSTGRNMEFWALNNVIAEGTNLTGTNFTTHSARLTYAQGKDMLILEGDGRIEAEVFQQKEPGTPGTHFAAQQIRYFPKTGRVEGDGVRSLLMNQGKK